MQPLLVLQRLRATTSSADAPAAHAARPGAAAAGAGVCNLIKLERGDIMASICFVDVDPDEDLESESPVPGVQGAEDQR